MRGVQKKKDKVQPPFQFILFTRSDLQLLCWYTIKQLEEVNKIKGRVSVCCLNCKRRKELTEFHCFIVLAVSVRDSYLCCWGFASPCCLRHATWQAGSRFASCVCTVLFHPGTEHIDLGARFWRCVVWVSVTASPIECSSLVRWEKDVEAVGCLVSRRDRFCSVYRTWLLSELLSNVVKWTAKEFGMLW